MAVTGWDTGEDGNLLMCPLLGYEIAVAQMFALVRLRYARDEQEFEAGGVALQLTMTPVQLRSLASGLLQMADQIDAQHLGTKQ